MTMKMMFSRNYTVEVTGNAEVTDNREVTDNEEVIDIQKFLSLMLLYLNLLL